MIGSKKMKKISKISIFLLTSILLLAGCGSEEKSVPNLDDVSFPNDISEDSTKPGTTELPNVGDEAVAPLDIDIAPTYFDNATTMHINLPGQWNGYGVHHPSVLKYGDTYYLYESTPDSNIGIRALRSTDLINWEFVTTAGFPLGYVTKDKLTYAAKSPQVIRHNGEFYLYFKSSKGYLVFNSFSPEGPFDYYSDLEFDSNYTCQIFKAPNNKLFFLSGGDKSVEIYEMEAIDRIDKSSHTFINATAISANNDGFYNTTSPSIIDVNGVAYLTYSSQDESFVSYRSYLVSAIEPDYSSASNLANSFFNQSTGPILLNTNDDNGSVGLGDVSIVEGADLVSYYAFYTSYETNVIRRLNISPVSFSNANINIAHRDTNSFVLNNEKHVVTDNDDELVLSEEQTEKGFSAQYNFENVDSVFFAYKTRNNCYRIDFGNEEATLKRVENGLITPLANVSTYGLSHTVNVSYGSSITVTLDNECLAYNIPIGGTSYGKIGYLKNSDSKISNTFFVNATSHSNMHRNVKIGEGNVYASMYLENESNLSSDTKIGMIDNKLYDLYGSSYLNIVKQHDYARFLVDVKEDARYGLELIYNTSFGKHGSYLGLRLGLNNEIMYKTSPIGETGFVRTLTAEFDVNKGVNELLVENLSNDNLKLVSVRLVKVSSYLPNYSNTLEDYATKGIKYATDFRISTMYKSHETYEGTRCFAYVGDNTITDFTMEIEVGFAGGVSTSGFVGLGFRCDNFASSSIDDNESLTGYYLEISLYQTKLMKHCYGYGQTIGVVDLANSVGDFAKYIITMKGNMISIFKEDMRIFTYEDQFAFSSGHLAFGSNNCNGLLRKLSVKAAE